MISIIGCEVSRLKANAQLDPADTVPAILLEIVGNGLLRYGREGTIEWPHQLFQEYYGAEELAKRYDSGKAIWRDLNSSDWKEAAIMAASFTTRPAKYVEYVLNGWRGWIGLLFFQPPRALLAIKCVTETKLADDRMLRDDTLGNARKRLNTGVNYRLERVNAFLLRSFGRPASRLFLRAAATSHQNQYLSRMLAWIFGVLQDSRAIPILQKYLRHKNPNVRWHAASSLRKIRNSVSLPSLIEALNDSDGDVQWIVIQALIDIGDSSAGSALVPLLYSPITDVRWAASFALGKIGTQAEIAALNGVANYDFAQVWWGETISQRAELAMAEIWLRNTSASDDNGKGQADMSDHVYS